MAALRAVENLEEDVELGVPIEIPPECTEPISLTQFSGMRETQVPFGPAAAAAPAAAPAAPLVSLAPSPPAAAPPVGPDCAKVFKKEAKQKKKAAKKAKKKMKKKCKTACKAADKLRKKAEKEAEDSAKKGGDAIKAQIKKIKTAIAKDTQAEVKAVKAAIKDAGKAAREELASAMKEDLLTTNETAKAAIQSLGEKVLAEDQEMFAMEKERETKLAEEVIKHVWDEGLHSAHAATQELTAVAGERANNISRDEVIPGWVNSEKEAAHAKNVSLDSLHSILTMWQSTVTSNHQDWAKVSGAFDSANTAGSLSHDTVAQVLSSVELSRLLRDTSVFYKMDAKEAYDRASALLGKAKGDLETTERNKNLIAGLEEKTDEVAGASTRAIDAAKKVVEEIKKKTKAK